MWPAQNFNFNFGVFAESLSLKLSPPPHLEMSDVECPTFAISHIRVLEYLTRFRVCRVEVQSVSMCSPRDLVCACTV